MSFPRYPKYKDSGVEWLGEVPEHWKLQPLKAVSSHNDDVLDEDTPVDHEITYVDISGVEGSSGIAEKMVMPFSAAPSRARRRVRHGDVIISTVRTYLRAIALVQHPEDNLIVSTGFAVIRPHPELHTTFAGHMLSANFFIEQVIARSTGVSYPSINASDLVSIGVPLPPRPEQMAIAAFLDRETAKIDALVAEQRRLIELLKEKRQAVVSHAVTKGLNPDAPMKPSGLECLGDVPTHWKVATVRRLVDRIEQGWSPDCYSRPAESDEWAVIKSGCVNRGVFLESENKALPDALEPMPEFEILSGDILMSRASGSPDLVGSTAIVRAVRSRLMLSDKIFRIQVEPTVEAEFFVWLFNSRSMRSQIERAISGADGLANNLPQASLKAFWCAIPPTIEQSAIVRYVHAETMRLDTLTAEAKRAIDLLQERRTALISAAVAGQIDVRGLAPSEATSATGVA